MGTILVTGGAGFIGSNFVRLALSEGKDRVVVLDKLTYAGNLESLSEVTGDPRFTFVRGDIADEASVEALFREHKPTSVVNFAAESHVDRSIDSPRPFIDTNIVGTFVLLEAARRTLERLESSEASAFRMVHVSTDEVFGSLGPQGLFTEQTSYAPNSPYAASKAAADHIVRAYHRTFGIPALVTNCSNNFGPYQFPEKLIPLMILNALEAKPLPIYGDGKNVRDWLYVEDHCEGLLLVLRQGRLGESYNIGGHCEKPNIELIDTLCDTLDQLHPAASNPQMKQKRLSSYRELKTFVPDRMGHDRRYAIDATKIRDELGWKPRHDFQSGLEKTIRWYIENVDWCSAVQHSGNYSRERLGLSDRAVD